MPPDGQSTRQLADHSRLIQFFAEKPHLLLTNNAPFEQDQTTLQILIAGAEHNMLACDTELRELETQIASSRRTRNEASRVLQLSKCILSPVRRLPREVVAEIVLHALQSPKISGWSVVATLDTHNGPWIYGQVCRIWREAVLSFPQLWTHFRFDQGATPPSMKPWIYEDLMAMVIQRSQHLPISFVFDEQALHTSAGVLRILIEQCHRWKDVDLTIDSEVSFVGLNDVRGKLPCLERLCLTARFELLVLDFDEIRSYRMDGFAEAPRLRILKLDLHMDELDLSFPIGQVELYKERDCGVGYPWNHNPPNFTNIVECSLGLTGWWNIRPMAYDTIELPRLRRLEISDPYILGNVIAPNLRFLRVDITKIGDEYHATNLYFESLCRMLSANTCALESFACAGAPESEELTEALELMPSLTSLRLLNIPYELDIIGCLTVYSAESHAHGTLLPKLELLMVALTSDSGEEHPTEFEGADSLVRLVDSRCRKLAQSDSGLDTSGSDLKGSGSEGAACLKQFYLTVECLGGMETFPVRMRERFAEMEKAGLRVILESRSRRVGMPMHPHILADWYSQRCNI